MLTQLFCSFCQRNVTGVPDPDRQKFQFLQAEHHPPPPPAAYCRRKAWPRPLPTASQGTLPVKKGKWETICTPARCFIASQAQMAPSSGPAQPRGRAATRTATPGLRTARACPRCEPERGSGRQLPTAPLRPAEGRKTLQGPLMTAFVPRWLRPESPRAQPALPAAVSPADRVTPSPSFRMAASSLGGNPITFW